MTILIIAATVFDGGGIDGGLAILKGLLPGTGVIDNGDIVTVTLGWVKFALTLIGLLAFIAFLWAGGLYVTSFINEKNNETAKKVMTWTAAGIIIILISYAVVSTLISATI